MGRETDGRRRFYRPETKIHIPLCLREPLADHRWTESRKLSIYGGPSAKSVSAPRSQPRGGTLPRGSCSSLQSPLLTYVVRTKEAQVSLSFLHGGWYVRLMVT